MLDNPEIRSKAGKSHFQMWSELCDLLVSHARDIRGIDVEKIVRSGIEGLGSSGGSCRLVWAPIRSLSETLRRYVDRIIRFVRRLIIDSFVCATLKGHKALLTPLGFLGFRCEFDCVTRMHYYILIIFLCLLH